MQRDVRKFGISDKRGRVMTSSDPYIPDEGLEEPAVCASCHAVYQQKRWIQDPLLFIHMEKEAATKQVTCPACQKIAEGYAEGILTLQGDYLWKHEEGIMRLLKNVEKKATAKNPIDRVLRRLREDERLVIETTGRKLAEHLGRALHRAHKGDISVSWSQDHDRCRVTWERMN